MVRRQREESPLVDSRYIWAIFLILITLSILTVRLWYIQVYKGRYYRKISEHNRIRKIEIPAPRGTIFDRYGTVVLGNRPFFDLVYIPQYGKNRDTTFKIVAKLLNEPVLKLERMLADGQGRPKYLPITLKRNLSIHEVSIIESNRIFLPGIEINVAPRRNYTEMTPPHIVGYLGEITTNELKAYNKENQDNPYVPGDLIGKQGIEKKWEKYLRGKSGHRLLQVDAFGRQTNILEKERLDLPVQPAKPGAELVLTVDLQLQNAAKKAFRGKYGAIVVLDPNNGDILAMVSSPDFDPKMYQESLTVEKWRALISDPYKPLFDKTTGGEFAPGSIYKPVIAIAALEEGIITPHTKHFCGGSFELGENTFHCHNRFGHGSINLKQALMKSCDVFFYNIGVELGVDRIAKYAKALGLGSKMGINLNKENEGLVPTNAWKKLTYRLPWTIGETPPISIGQGANLITPIQMASLYATLANGGTIYRPNVVKSVISHMGDTLFEHQPEIISQVSIIKPQTFRTIAQMLQAVVMDDEGTGKNARVEGTTVAGKTGSVQVVSLKKNRNRTDVSMRWKEHAMFAAFSPTKNPEVAVAIVSENDRIGGGGASAAPVAKEIIETFWKLKKQRQLTVSKRHRLEKQNDRIH
ncbi:MAG: penicillin-binding protein 2 [Bdellovibrionota bacterium]